MKRISLTQGKFALVDDVDYEWLNQWKWHLHKAKRALYAIRNTQRTTVKMHREILGLKYNDGKQCDHINGNGLDNQKHNLRICSHQENCHNARPNRNASSKYKGVYRRREERIWCARIKYNNKKKSLGYYHDEEKAAQAYDEAAKKLFGKFAWLNFPQKLEVINE